MQTVVIQIDDPTYEKLRALASSQIQVPEQMRTVSHLVSAVTVQFAQQLPEVVRRKP